MKPAEILDRVLSRWWAKLPPRFSRVEIDGFVRRHQRVLEDLVILAVAQRRAEAGHSPESAPEFAAYDPIVTRERARDIEPDDAVMIRLMAMIDEDFRTGHYHEESVLSNLGLEYVDTRAEAILLRARGWDAVPLLLDRPALAVVVAGSVVAFRNHMGSLAIHPDRRGTLNHLYADLSRAEETILRMRDEQPLEWNTKERLQRYALAIWAGARAAASQLTFPRTTP